ncbi:hypothetical protein SAMN04487904_101219 [Actinopolyspora lacussalsi subsp. righensis]|uniref:Ketohydroxyglutarate aldolase n=1 Tax=Actinopolyspora righensis TaxID=995060 RepID=A0A1I6X5Z0_9ACTN|nr:hypothetical protein [Actinopolyspora righensis]SFT33607.1 hypothetical protein SAMN04487904_101219 [Actinopolyspora righensis]
MTDEVVVTVNEEWLDHIDTVARRLRRVGMRVDRVLELVGVITGVLEREHFDAARAVPGVAAVERGETVRIPRGENQ